MSYEGLSITKGGVTLDIPLCDSSTTLMTLHLLYDCYIQLLTLDLHLTWLNITMHMYSCETTWLEQALQDIIGTRFVVMKPTLWHACDSDGGELMPSLVVHDGVHALHGDILMKWTLTSIASWCIGVAPPSNSSANMHIVILGAVELTTYLCIVSVLIFQCVLVVMHISCQLHVQL